MMMFFIAVVHGVAANEKGQRDHDEFKARVVNDIDPKERKTGQQ